MCVKYDDLNTGSVSKTIVDKLRLSLLFLNVESLYMFIKGASPFKWMYIYGRLCVRTQQSLLNSRATMSFSRLTCTTSIFACAYPVTLTHRNRILSELTL